MNLLPKTEKEVLKKGLKTRFVLVFAYLLSLSILLGLVALLPAYFLMRAHSSIAKQQYLVKILDENSTKEILNLPTKIDSELKFLQSNLNNPSIINVFQKVTGSVPNGVTINAISFSRNEKYKEKNGIHILISGAALDRDSLVSFSKLLRESIFFSSVDIPVSSLTKEKNLPFSIDLFIENQK